MQRGRSQRSCSRSFQRWIQGLLTAALVVSCCGLSRAPKPSLIDKVHENLLYHLTQLAQWPKAKQSGPRSLCLLGDVAGVAGLARKRADSGPSRGLRVKTYGEHILTTSKGVAELGRCHVLFVKLPAASIAKSLPRLHRDSVLTVGLGEGFALSLGIIAFVEERRRVGLRVNLKRSRGAGLKLSATLLQHAKLVGATK